MNCEVCDQEYNEDTRVPLLLVGGHTFGKAGLEGSKIHKGPSCKISIDTPISSLNKNFALLKMNNKVSEFFHEMGLNSNRSLVYGSDGRDLVYFDDIGPHKYHACKFLNQTKSESLLPFKTFLDEIESKLQCSKIEHTGLFEEAKKTINSHVDETVNSVINKIKENADNLKKSMLEQYQELSLNLDLKIVIDLDGHMRDMIIAVMMDSEQLELPNVDLNEIINEIKNSVIEGIEGWNNSKNEHKAISFLWGDLREAEVRDTIIESCLYERQHNLIETYCSDLKKYLEGFGKDKSELYMQINIDKSIKNIQNKKLQGFFEKDLMYSLLIGNKNIDGVNHIITMVDLIADIYKKFYIDKNVENMEEEDKNYFLFIQRMETQFNSFINELSKTTFKSFDNTIKKMKELKIFFSLFTNKLERIHKMCYCLNEIVKLKELGNDSIENPIGEQINELIEQLKDASMNDIEGKSCGCGCKLCGPKSILRKKNYQEESICNLI